MKTGILIGIGGGTGSGKTSVAKNILKKRFYPNDKRL